MTKTLVGSVKINKMSSSEKEKQLAIAVELRAKARSYAKHSDSLCAIAEYEEEFHACEDEIHYILLSLENETLKEALRQPITTQVLKEKLEKKLMDIVKPSKIKKHQVNIDEVTINMGGKETCDNCGSKKHDVLECDPANNDILQDTREK